MKKFIFASIVLICLMCSSIFAQDISINMVSKEIFGNQFEGFVNITINNTSLDTLLIPISPFKCEIVDNINYCYSFPRYGTFTNNRITFFKKKNGFKEFSGYNPISYLRLPKIIILPPSRNINLKLIFEEGVNNKLSEYSWEIICDVWYANKKDINTLLNGEYYSFRREFEDALINKDTLVISTVLDNQISSNIIFESKYEINVNDSTLFFYKDGEKIKYTYKSEYDIILSYFNNLIE